MRQIRRDGVQRQWAMHEIFERTLPIACANPRIHCGRSMGISEKAGSIHVQEFPDEKDSVIQPPITKLPSSGNCVRLVYQAIEKARQEKLIGNALEAAVVLKSNSDVTTKIDKEELEEFFILSDLTIEQTKEASAMVTKTSYRNARAAGVIAHMLARAKRIRICATGARA